MPLITDMLETDEGLEGPRNRYYQSLADFTLQEFAECQLVLIAVVDEDMDQCCVAVTGKGGPIGSIHARTLLEMLEQVKGTLLDAIARAEGQA